MALERELKFSTLEETFPGFEELKAVFGQAAYVLSAIHDQEQEDRYFDDENKSLQKAGLALRKRTANGHVFATLKRQARVEGALHERDEIELPLKGEWPHSITKHIAEITNPLALQSQLDIKIHRLSYSVHKNAAKLAILSFDEVSANYPNSTQQVYFNEVEIEAVGQTDAKSLQAIASVLEGILRINPNTVNKLERAQALLSLGSGFADE